ncbi:MAG: hypothetical protein IPM24_20145 [Bryobacterales bacterium]|nr:hypothetical protein [Bryobacterales bacterium]
MKIKLLILCVSFVASLQGQFPLNTTPTRILGHSQNQLVSGAVNLVEGREFNGPQGLAIDTSVTPPRLYVADTSNNRVLAWQNASAFQNGARADLVIGQRDLLSTSAGGPGTVFSSGLRFPAGLTVDRDGNLYVADTGNNRILRFPRPFDFAGQEQLPDLVLGQVGLSCSTCAQANSGGISARTLSLSSTSVFGGSLRFDSQGNLWVADSANFRVLRYPASVLGPGAVPGPAADMVVGQLNFTGREQLPSTFAGQNEKFGFRIPGGLAFDPAGRLFVTDPALSRVLVFEPPFTFGKSASRIMGIVQPPAQGQPPLPAADDTRFLGAESVFTLGNQIAVADTGNHRILIFDAVELWPPESTRVSPRAIAAVGPIGQEAFAANRPNRDRPEAAADSFNTPIHAAVSSEELFVADAANHRVVVYSRSLLNQRASAVRVLGQENFHSRSPNRIEGREFSFIAATQQGVVADAGIAIDTRSNPPHLYVADPYNNRVLCFRDIRQVSAGRGADLVIGQPDFQRSVVNYPSGNPDIVNDQGLFLPIGLAVDPDGNLWVADSGNGRVLRFPSPFQRNENFPRANLVIGQLGFGLKVTDPTARTMSRPYGIAFAGENGLLVSDLAHNRVLFFRGRYNEFTNGPSAELVFGQPDFNSVFAGSGDNQMRSPRHIATDTDDRLYVADTANNRILIFNRAPVAGPNPRAGTILTQVASTANLNSPRGIYVSAVTGEIWVTEGNVNRISRYPRFDDLAAAGGLAGLTVPAASGFVGLAVALDGFGNLVYPDSANRVAFHFPQVAALNGANELVGRALAPGIIGVAYRQGPQFAASEVVTGEVPWPTDLNDTEVRINGVAAPLYYVFPDKLAFFMPWSAPESGTADMEVIRTSTGQVLGAGRVEMGRISPGLFALDGSGRGQLAALNEDNSVNGPANPIQRGKVIQLFATGQGRVPSAPPDGAPAVGLIPTPIQPRVSLGPSFVPDDHVLFSGLAPGLIGVWQINVRVPETVAPNSRVPLVVVYDSAPSAPPGAGTLFSTIAVSQ